MNVDSIAFMRDGFGQALEWEEIVGVDLKKGHAADVNTSQVNVEIIVQVTGGSTIPTSVKVQFWSRPPNLERGLSTMRVPKFFDVPAVASLPDGRQAHRLTLHLEDLGFSPLADVPREVASIRRPVGTSDGVFRAQLGGWTNRGAAVQPDAVDQQRNSGSGDVVFMKTGDSTAERPDALGLFTAGGVEVLQCDALLQPGWTISLASAKCLVRSPAKAFYYTGHGRGPYGCLAIELGLGYFPCWSYPTWTDWASTSNLDVLVLAGCSVLHFDDLRRPPRGVGMRWAKLLHVLGGPLQAVLGYRGSAPGDVPVGNEIALDIGYSLQRGSTSLVRDWLNINIAHKAWNAAAIDASGYYEISTHRSFYFGHNHGTISGPYPIV